MNWDVFNKLRMHPQILGLIGVNKDKLTGVSESQIATVLGVDEILIGKVKKNTAAEGQTASFSSVWGKHILFAYRNPNPSPSRAQNSFGYTFQRQAVIGDTIKVSDPKNAEFVRVTERYDDVILDFDAGYLVTDAVA